MSGSTGMGTGVEEFSMLVAGELEKSFRFPACPAGPGFALDWPAVLAAHPWLGPLAEVPQDPIHHAEGDVLTHTRMVAAALVALPAWQTLPEVERQILFAAALFHDLGKQVTTYEENGRIHAPHHARRGEMMAREILWQDETPTACREAIAALVRWHGLPLNFIGRRDIDRGLIEVSWRVRLDRVALLAEADCLGRHCADPEDLQERLALFRARAEELHCADRPFAFANDHSRVGYFRRPQQFPTDQLFDDTIAEAILLCGLPGSGKDTYAAKHLAHLPVISLDALRTEMGVDPRENQGRILQEAKERARVFLRRGEPFVLNATNLRKELRSSWIELFADYRFRTRILYLDLARTTLLQRNHQRQAQARVPAPVIATFLAKFEPPQLTEAHQVDWLDAS